MISERLMQLGDWGIRLVPETPLSLRRSFEKWDSLIVTPSRLPYVEALGSTEIKELARYRGPLLEMSQDRTTLRGAGMLYYLGNANNDGPWIEQWIVTPLDWSEHLDVISGQYALAGLTRQAVVDEPSVKWPPTGASADELPHITRPRLEYLAEVLGCEYYVSPDDKFYSGGAESDSLFRVTQPQVMLMRGHEGRDIDLIGLAIESWDVTDDGWDVAGGAVVATSGGEAYVYGASPTSAVMSPIGDPNFHVGVVVDTGDFVKYEEQPSNTALGGMSERAGAIRSSLGAASAPYGRRTIGVAVNVYDPHRWMVPGDYVYAYDPINQVHDEDNGVTYHGMHVHPAKLRLWGMTWPVMEGMGVYLLNGDHYGSYSGDLILDLTDYIEWEDGATTLEVDAPHRSYDQ